MAAITSAITVQGDPNGSPKYGGRLDVAAGAVIYVGSLVFVNSSGYAVSLSPDQNMACVGYYDGASYQGRDLDNTAGAAGDLTVVPRIGEMDLTNGSAGDAISADDAGKLAYASDNQTANLTSNSNVRCPIGPIIGMNGTKVRVVAGHPGSKAIGTLENASVTAAPVITTVATGAFSGEFALSSIGNGILKHSGGTPATAIAGTDYYAPGSTDVAVVDGGTGASSAADARTNLGLVIGTDVQAYDADLLAIAALDATAGLLAKTAANTYARRSVAVSGAGLSVANGDGAAANPTLSLADDIQALEGIAGTGLLTRTGAGTAAARTVTGTAGRITVSNGDGVAGDPTLDVGVDIYRAAGTDVAVTDGGTGASSAATARVNLGLEIGVNVQGYDAELAAVASLAGTGIMAHTGAGTMAERQLVAPAAGITITNDTGVSGNPTFALANDLAAYEGLAANGLVARTGDGSASARTLSAGSTGVAITNGDGVAGNPTVDNLFAPIGVADPGDAAAIPVTRSATIAITTGAGAETNTLAIPTFLGQELVLTMDVDGGGNRAITAASAINVAGNTIMTFGEARDTIVLKAIQLAGVRAWEVIANNGVALT